MWREVVISYAVRPDMDFEAVEDEMIDAALAILGCDCSDDSPEDYECKAGDWVASSRPCEFDDE